MVASQDFTWAQGEDLPIQLRYKEGLDAASAVVVDLSTGYQLRMDIVVPNTKQRLYTFNSATIADVDPVQAGAQADTVIESTLTSGAGGTPNINIQVPRSLTLPTTGVIYLQMTASPAQMIFNYDVFLRNTVSGFQSKILRGTITVEESYTLWL